MKRILAALAFALVLPAGSARAGINLNIGSGPDHSSFVIEGFAPGPLVYSVFYTFNASAAPDSYDLLSLADTADGNLTLSWVNYGTVDDPSYFLDSIQYGAESFTNTGAPTFSPYWAQWVSGGKAGYPAAIDIADNSWGFGSGLSRPFRLHEPGSWDGYVYNDGTTAPATLPIPEPSVLLFGVAAFAAACTVRRRS